MKKTLWLAVLGLFGLTMFQTFIPQEASAVPAFARKYRLPCTMCHIQFPKLNAFGVAFKSRGDRMEGEEGEFPFAPDQSFPIAVHAMMGYRYSSLHLQDAVNNTAAFGAGGAGVRSPYFRNSVITATTEPTPGGGNAIGSGAPADAFHIEFFLAGSIAPGFTTFADMVMIESVTGTPGAGLGQIWVSWNDVLGGFKKELVNVKAGRFDSDFLWLSDARRLTLDHYTFMMNNGGVSGGLGGLVNPGTEADSVVSTGLPGAVEVNGMITPTTRYMIGGGNSGFSSATSVAPATTFPGARATTNNYVERFYLGLAQTFFGAPGEGQSLGVMYNTDMVGGSGQQGATSVGIPAVGTRNAARIWSVGVVGDINPPWFPGMNIAAAYYRAGSDCNRSAVVTATNSGCATTILRNDAVAANAIANPNSNSYMVEVNFYQNMMKWISEDMTATYRYEGFDVENSRATGYKHVVSVGYYFRPNVQLRGEYSYRDVRLAPVAAGQTIANANDWQMDLFNLQVHVDF